jgi:hypothetical protein
LHVAAAVTVNVVVADGASDRSRKSAELDVKLDDPEAPVIAKPAGAEICTEPSVWVDASFVTEKVKVVFAPAEGLDCGTATAKHLPDAMQALEVAPAQGAASTAAPSRPAANAPNATRATLKLAFGTTAPFSCVDRRP